MRQKHLRTTSQLQEDYDQISPDYDRMRFGTHGGKYVEMKEQEFVARMIGGSSVLEVGTATGRFAVSLTKRGAEYTGVDLSQRMFWFQKLLRLRSLHPNLPLPPEAC